MLLLCTQPRLPGYYFGHEVVPPFSEEVRFLNECTGTQQCNWDRVTCRIHHSLSPQLQEAKPVGESGYEGLFVRVLSRGKDLSTHKFCCPLLLQQQTSGFCTASPACSDDT